MTSLLTRPDTARTDAARPRPLVLIATLGGVSAALAPLVVLLAVGVIGWFVTDAGVHGAPRDGMRMGALAWLAGHGSGFTVMGARVTVVPLGVTAMTVWSMWRLGHRVGDAVSGHGPDADRISDGERDLTVPIAIMTFFAGYAVVAVVVATLAAGTSVDPSVPRVLAWTVVLTALVAAPAIAVGSGRAAIWATFVPVTVRAGAAVAGAVLGALLAVSTVAFLVTLRDVARRRGDDDLEPAPEPGRGRPLRPRQRRLRPQRGALHRLLPARPRVRRRRRHARHARRGRARPAPGRPAARRPARRRHARRVGGRPDAAAAASSPRSPPTGRSAPGRWPGTRSPSPGAAAGWSPASASPCSPRSPAGPPDPAGCASSDPSAATCSSTP